MVEKNFKHTEIGLIPEDWELVRIGDSFQFKNGLNKEKDFFGYGFPIVNYMDVFKGTFITSDLIKGKVFLSKQELRNFDVKKGDVLFTRTSETQEEIGYSSVVVEDLKDTVFSGFVLRARPFNNLFDIQFCRYGFSNRIVREQIISNATYTTRALTNGRVLSEVKIPLPPLPEQQAIAATLTHTDEWIESLEKLIAKKRLIKQGAMQKLLTPKSDWEVKKLGEIGNCLRGVSYAGDNDLYENDNDNSIKLLRSNNIYNSKVVYSNVLNVKKEKVNAHQIIQKQDILICMANGSKELVGKAGYFNDIYDSSKFTFGAFMGIFRINSYEVDPYFIFVNFLSKNYRSHIDLLLSGSSINNLKPMDIESIEIKVPLLSEQTRIATILSDMDSEIEALEQKLSKAKQMKQGMMQELLTGRIRLIEKIKTEKPKTNKGHNEHINDAVLIGTMAACFGSAQFPMTRFKYTKVSYLLKRYKEEQDTGYLKKAAGPYKPQTRYGGAEKIALQNRYVVSQQAIYKGKPYEGFVSGEEVDKAIAYFKEWYGEEALQWISKFKFEKNDNLELWATVDMAIQDLKKECKLVNVANVKQIIKENKEWKDKLKRPAFSDDNIHNAIIKMDTLFA